MYFVGSVHLSVICVLCGQCSFERSMENTPFAQDMNV